MATPSRRHPFPWFCKELSSQKRVHTIVILRGVVRTLRRSNSLSRSVFSMAGSFGYPKNNPDSDHGLSFPCEFTIAWWFTIADTPFSWESQIFRLSRKGSQRSRSGGRSKKTLRRSNSLSRSVFSMVGSFGQVWTTRLGDSRGWNINRTGSVFALPKKDPGLRGAY